MLESTCYKSLEIYAVWDVDVVLRLHLWDDALRSIDWSAAVYAFADHVIYFFTDQQQNMMLDSSML